MPTNGNMYALVRARSHGRNYQDFPLVRRWWDRCVLSEIELQTIMFNAISNLQARSPSRIWSALQRSWVRTWRTRSFRRWLTRPIATATAKWARRSSSGLWRRPLSIKYKTINSQALHVQEAAEDAVQGAAEDAEFKEYTCSWTNVPRQWSIWSCTAPNKILQSISCVLSFWSVGVAYSSYWGRVRRMKHVCSELRNDNTNLLNYEKVEQQHTSHKSTSVSRLANPLLSSASYKRTKIIRGLT